MTNQDIPNLINSSIDRLESRLEERLEERHADLRERLDELRQDVGMLTGALLSRLDAHDDYHRRNEHRWGLVRLAARYPFRLALIVGGLGAGFSAAPEFRRALLQVIADLAGRLP